MKGRIAYVQVKHIDRNDQERQMQSGSEQPALTPA